MNKIFLSVVLSGMLLIGAALPSLVLAQTKTGDCGTLEQQIKDLGGSGSKEAQELLKKFPQHCSASSSISKVITLALSFAGVAAVLAIIYGGFLMITSAGNEEAFGKGKKTLVFAIVGLIVILLAGVIVRLVASTVNSSVT